MRRQQRVRLDGKPYPYSDAKKDVIIRRELIDIWNGEPGKDAACMNAQCVLRNRSAFPHPVKLVSVIKSRVYILDRDDHAVRYILSAKDGADIARHDVLASARPATLILRVPKGRERQGMKGDGGHRAARPGRTYTGHSTAKGAAGRLLAAVGANRVEKDSKAA